jgi:TonB-dependent SusC/RagA subfamily outer membrane receptor
MKILKRATMGDTATPALLICVTGLLAACGGGQSAPPRPGLSPGDEDRSTGATDSIEANDQRFVQTVQELIQGQVSGVQVVDHPTCGVTLRIRGVSGSLMDDGGAGECEREPLLIIDGKQVPLGGMARAFDGLRPSDIDRVRVLKDVASTSVYGTRGANGVILITTRR